ncbi:MAG: sigma-54 dependent transcriptional regulator [Candidatus Cloacimonetes bacterium]|nr:sigma-54 dependent transcriptional regulator [Candidatus Cloacimonadota bacterium]
MKILLVEDDRIQNKLLCDFLKSKQYKVISTHSAEEALYKFNNSTIDIIISDFRLPQKNGKELLTEIIKIKPETPVIIITAYSTVDGAVELMKMGAFDYLQKPIDLERLSQKIINAEKYIKLQSGDKLFLENNLSILSKDFFLGNSQIMNNIFKIVEKVSQSDVPVLITGESGTGKEMIADLLHKMSSRNKEKIIKINCAAIPENLLESELFGHTKGAFTGATQDRKGKFEEADKGTIFLDEIGDLPMLMQVKLLRFLQSMTFEPIGSNTTKYVDVRIVSATNKNLITAINNNEFREDLYYRLNVIPIELPPLRDRKEDIPGLINFLSKNLFPNQDINFSPEVLINMSNYKWDGNIRQLKNYIQRIVTLSPNKLISVNDLPIELIEQDIKTNNSFKTLAEKEKEWITEALIKTNYNQQEAANLLGLHRNTISKKIKEYKISTKK